MMAKQCLNNMKNNIRNLTTKALADEYGFNFEEAIVILNNKFRIELKYESNVNIKMAMTKEEHEQYYGKNKDNNDISLTLELPSVDNSIHQPVSVKVKKKFSVKLINHDNNNEPIDFSQFDCNKFSKLLSSLSNYTDNNLNYPTVGKLVEKAFAEYCNNNSFKRVNQCGYDLLYYPNNSQEKKVESKVTKFTNKSERAVRNVIIKNTRSSCDNYELELADYYIFTDIKKRKACCVTSNKLFNFKNNGACITASCDPEPEDFFLTEINNNINILPRDYFQEADDFDLHFIRSI